jgi:hypothetical protein
MKGHREQEQSQHDCEEPVQKAGKWAVLVRIASPAIASTPPKK